MSSHKLMIQRTDLYDTLLEKIPEFADRHSLDPLVDELAELIQPKLINFGSVQWFQNFLRSTLDFMDAKAEIEVLQGLHHFIDQHADAAHTD